MSSIEFIPVIKEMGAFGIALYALYTMNNLHSAIRELSLQVSRCPKNV